MRTCLSVISVWEKWVYEAHLPDISPTSPRRAGRLLRVSCGFRPHTRTYLLLYTPQQVGPDEPTDAPRQLTGQTGSARYMAPEVARSRPYGTSAEVYSATSYAYCSGTLTLTLVLTT